jgi:hypothetical protein
LLLLLFFSLLLKVDYILVKPQIETIVIWFRRVRNGGGRCRSNISITPSTISTSLCMRILCSLHNRCSIVDSCSYTSHMMLLLLREMVDMNTLLLPWLSSPFIENISMDRNGWSWLWPDRRWGLHGWHQHLHMAEEERIPVAAWAASRERIPVAAWAASRERIPVVALLEEGSEEDGGEHAKCVALHVAR